MAGDVGNPDRYEFKNPLFIPAGMLDPRGLAEIKSAGELLMRANTTVVSRAKLCSELGRTIAALESQVGKLRSMLEQLRAPAPDGVGILEVDARSEVVAARRLAAEKEVELAERRRRASLDLPATGPVAFLDEGRQWP
jgi:hypothetical protein